MNGPNLKLTLVIIFHIFCLTNKFEWEANKINFNFLYVHLRTISMTFFLHEKCDIYNMSNSFFKKRLTKKRVCIEKRVFLIKKYYSGN